MPDEIFRPRRPNQREDIDTYENANNENANNENTANIENLDLGAKIRLQAAEESEESIPTRPIPQNEAPGAMKLTGNIPPEILQKMSGQQEPKKGFGQIKNPEQKQVVHSSGNEHLRDLISNLKMQNAIYEEIELPSKGRFYDGENGPIDGVLAIRAMTGEEEQILATPRFVRRGQAINMIFKNCMKDAYKPENLLTIDRTYLLIYLRGISYTTKYEVEVKCPNCESKFETTINLDEMFVEPCPDNYGPILQDVLPNTKLPFTYRLSTGKDEQDITDYRDRRVKQFGDNTTDDTLTYRTAMLLHEIDGIKTKNDLQVLLKNLPINDVSYIRNCINEPPFGVDTNIEIICPSCMHDFSVDLPLEASFFFPRRKKGLHNTQV